MEYSEFLLSGSVLAPFLRKCWPIIPLPPSLSNVNYPDRPLSLAGSYTEFLYNFASLPLTALKQNIMKTILSCEDDEDSSPAEREKHGLSALCDI